MSDIFSPETIAWKMVTNEIDEKFSSQIYAINPDNINDDNPLSFTFELLITIFMEMIYYLLHIENKEDFDETDIKNNIEMFKTKFLAINTMLYITEYGVSEINNTTFFDRYCKIILKNQNEYFFSQNEIDVEYHMLLNPFYETKHKLKNNYAILQIKNKTYKIYFEKIEK